MEDLTGQDPTVTILPVFNAVYPDQNVTTLRGYDALGRTVRGGIGASN